MGCVKDTDTTHQHDRPSAGKENDMMNLADILNNAYVQSEAKYAYYDYDKDERVELTYEQAKDREILYIYCENNIIFFEVEGDYDD